MQEEVYIIFYKYIKKNISSPLSTKPPIKWCKSIRPPKELKENMRLLELIIIENSCNR